MINYLFYILVSSIAIVYIPWIITDILPNVLPKWFTDFVFSVLYIILLLGSCYYSTVIFMVDNSFAMDFIQFSFTLGLISIITVIILKIDDKLRYNI